MRINWDDSKNEKLKRERGLSFEIASQIFISGHAVDKKNDDPEQFRAIGFSKGQIITLIFEHREDEDGDIIWLVTCWKATRGEVKIYEQARR